MASGEDLGTVRSLNVTTEMALYLNRIKARFDRRVILTSAHYCLFQREILSKSSCSKIEAVQKLG